MIGGATGSVAGASAAEPVLGLFAGVAAEAYVGMNPSTVGAAGGGLAGISERGQRSARAQDSVAHRVEAGLFAMDRALPELERKIREAPDRAAMEALQTARLDLLQRREQAGELLTSIRLGVLDADGEPTGHGAEGGSSDDEAP